MRKVKLTDGQEIEIRPITRGQIRKLADQGVTAAGIVSEITPENYDSVLDAVLSTQVAIERVEELPLPDCRELFNAIVAETWGSKEEEKNSSTPGPTAQAGSN
ncbi:MAG: hypothetical protein M0036_10280 [Desulfobacteraceae bacterium]|nr:hypothetical protein [Desulfobacteraceae bacterium]